MISSLGELTQKYPALQIAIQNANKDNGYQLNLQTKTLFLSNQISLSQYNQIQSYVKGLRQVSTIEGSLHNQRTSKIKSQQATLQQWNKQKEDIELDFAKAMMPATTEMANVLKKIRPYIKHDIGDIGGVIKEGVKGLNNFVKLLPELKSFIPVIKDIGIALAGLATFKFAKKLLGGVSGGGNRLGSLLGGGGGGGGMVGGCCCRGGGMSLGGGVRNTIKRDAEGNIIQDTESAAEGDAVGVAEGGMFSRFGSKALGVSKGLLGNGFVQGGLLNLAGYGSQKLGSYLSHHHHKTLGKWVTGSSLVEKVGGDALIGAEAGSFIPGIGNVVGGV